MGDSWPDHPKTPLQPKFQPHGDRNLRVPNFPPHFFLAEHLFLREAHDEIKFARPERASILSLPEVG